MREKMSKLYECQPCISSSIMTKFSEPRLVDQDAYLGRRTGHKSGCNDSGRRTGHKSACIDLEKLDIRKQNLSLSIYDM